MCRARGSLCRVVFRLRSSRIEDFERPVLPCRKLQVLARVWPIYIRDVIGRDVMFGSAVVGNVKLPQVFEAWRMLDDVPCRRTATLLGSVVHDGDTRRDAIQKNRTAAFVPPMVRNDIDVDCSELIDGAHQIEFLVMRQIPEVQNGESAEVN
jgi:hypothetical protein